MRKTYIFLIIIFVFANVTAEAQTNKKSFRIVKYNVENFFDLVDDPLTNDEEYLPGGYRGWNMTKYMHKQRSIAKVVSSIGEWNPPAIVGMSEVESIIAMTDLTEKSPLKNLGYKFIQYESPDPRGIDVVLMYDPKQFKPSHQEAIPIDLFRTRDILYVKGNIPNKEELHVFVCHFPSRYGGELESEFRREYVAEILRNKVDQLFAEEENPNIFIMGDFNDYPTNNSMLKSLRAHPLEGEIKHKSLYNMAYKSQVTGKGSYKFHGEWGMLDQMIVSGNMLYNENSISTTQDDFKIFSAEYLLENDESFLGEIPYRTYIGMRYHGGFSDHLPVYIDLWYEE